MGKGARGGGWFIHFYLRLFICIFNVSRKAEVSTGLRGVSRWNRGGRPPRDLVVRIRPIADRLLVAVLTIRIPYLSPDRTRS